MAILDIEYGKEILEDTVNVGQRERLEMEMLLQNSSYGHEYAMIELQETQSLLEREAIDYKLEECRKSYFQARKYLEKHCPLRLQAIESELLEQKTRNFKVYSA